jgi:ribosomal protein S18 acetylase RimI-like enzyme
VSSPPRTLPAPAGNAAFVIRELRWTDFDDLRDTYFQLYEEREVDPEIGISLFRTRPSHADEVRWFTDMFRDVLSGTSIVAIAERDGHAVGSCVVRRVGPAEESELAHYGVLGIVVRKADRGSGIGRALLVRILEGCRGKFELVRLQVFATNVRARELYGQFGFVRVGTVPAAVRRGDRYLDVVEMVLDLRPRSGG